MAEECSQTLGKKLFFLIISGANFEVFEDADIKYGLWDVIFYLKYVFKIGGSTNVSLVQILYY